MYVVVSSGRRCRKEMLMVYLRHVSVVNLATFFSQCGSCWFATLMYCMWLVCREGGVEKKKSHSASHARMAAFGIVCRL